MNNTKYVSQITGSTDALTRGGVKGCIYFSTTYMLFHFCLFTYYLLFIY
jgi:hypothetical protein